MATKIFAAATCSWIDPATKLPEVDTNPINFDTTTRAFLIGNQGYRFSNYTEIEYQTDPGGTVTRARFTPQSDMYRGPSYARIPSHAFSIDRQVFQEPDAWRFTQVVGARTVSPEVLGTGGGMVGGAIAGGIAGSFVPVVGTALGAFVGGASGLIVGEIGGHQIKGFPPIWSKVQIRIFKDGRTEATLLQHSIFPSLTFFTKSSTGQGFERTSKTAAPYYDATKDIQLPDWLKNGWGALQNMSTPGPCRGNPWGVKKGITGGGENIPSG